MNYMKILKSRFVLNITRYYYSNVINAISLKYSEIGDPQKVIHKVESSLTSKLKPNEVLVKFLAAAVHPSDINTVQGQYPIKPPLPAVVGNEGYAEVIDSGTSSLFKEGDRAIPKSMNSGTWRSHRICLDTELIKLNKHLSPETGAICAVNPGTAFRMLKDFCTLNRGDVFIQNGGTSAVAIYATQLAKLAGINSISIIRARQNVEDTTAVKKVLRDDFGASFVLTEEEVKSKLQDVINETGLAKLAFNCVGGKAVLPLLKGLDKSGIIVTYGGMSRFPMQVPVSSLIFSDVRIRGFWMSAWSESRRDTQLRQEMLDELCDAFNGGALKPSPFNTFDFSTRWQDALTRAMFTDQSPQGLNKKNILIMGGK